jgi:DNA-binding phage protein
MKNVDRPVNCERLAAELLRALRGKRSRPGFSRYLGYRSNVAQRWETEACWPTATRFFEICLHLRIDVRAAVEQFLRNEPSWLQAANFGAVSGVASLLQELAGRTRLTSIARASGYNRYSLARWLKGSAVPKLPEFFRVLDVSSRRLLDFIATLVDPASLPSVATRWKRLVLSRELAHTHPLSHAVLRAIELDEYKREHQQTEQYLARRLGISREEVKRSLSLLAESGQIRQTRRGWVARQGGVVDTGADPRRSRALKLEWARAAIERLESGAPGHSGYALFAISKSDLRRLHEIQLAYVKEMQSVIAASTPSECVGLFCAQLIDLSVADDNALALSGTVSLPARFVKPRWM